MKVIVYHDDNDGRCAAAIAVKYFKETGAAAGKVGERINFVPATYDKAQEIVDGIDQGDEVYIVDFSLPKDLFTELVKKAPQTVWIDHHVSSIKKLDGTMISALPGIRDINAAACLLAWNHWFPKEDAPISVKLIADRDGWVWAYKEQTAEFHYGLSLHETDPQSGLWDMLLREPSAVATNKIKSDGRIALRLMGQRFADLRGAVMFETTIDGHSAKAMNIAIAGSAAFGADGWAIGALPDDVEICCQYYHNGEVFTVSMYSKKGTVDVSELCKKRGGGGHAHAAGFTSVELPDFLRKR
jgi:oligoribonuclease NrnB/cAMP/cGMP phosphodiesterase (DHH superfamily)